MEGEITFNAVVVVDRPRETLDIEIYNAVDALGTWRRIRPNESEGAIDDYYW